MSSHRGDILVVDDERDIRELIGEILQDEGYRVTTAANGVQAREAWRQQVPDVVFLDVWMPDIDGITLLRQMKDEGLLTHTNVIMISGHGTISTAVEATRLGAWDFLEKPISLNRLLVATERALKHLKLARRERQLDGQRHWDSELIGKSRAMQALRADAERLARYTMPVLLLGERGSGRHQFARAVHRQSPRKERPLLVVDAQQLNAEKTHWLGQAGEDGALQLGELARVNGGTLVINDIHRLDAEWQSTLLGLLQDGTLKRPGTEAPMQLDVRLFGLSDAPLSHHEDFLPQLAQRFDLTTIEVPPLRQRLDDLPELVEYFTDRLARTQGLTWRPFDISALNALRLHSWPGNLLELQNLIQRCLLQGEGPVTAEEVQGLLQAPQAEPTAGAIDTSLPLKAAREAFEAAYLRQLLRETGGNMSETAQRAGLERTHLYRKLKQLNIDPKAP
ncbi:sigma-54 dependent transcriptional regulator [Sulfurivirga sp.]|uniref:sigma-54-dependent transcriptional regulator n=1 Tax=Sulfurivirga sp. TaxID=2614236 RepID=UPI0025ED1C29|nr:sigma-54 dependent transcriptional regulator [Sulfurivirga sp.]